MTLPDAPSLFPALASWRNGSYQQPAMLCPPSGNGLDARKGEELLRRLSAIRFNPEQIQQLGALRGDEGRSLFEESFLNYLQRFSFSGKWNGNCLHGPLIQLLIAQPVVESFTSAAWMIEKLNNDAIHL